MLEKYITTNRDIFIRTDSITIHKRQGAFVWFIEGKRLESHCPTHETLISEGYYKIVQESYNSDTHKLDTTYNYIGEEASLNVVELTSEEITTVYQAKRDRISAKIYQIAFSYVEQLTLNYGRAESSRWEVDKQAIAISDWSRFDARSGSTLTGQQYAESKVIPKITAGEAFLDMIIGKRTDLFATLDACLDRDLDSFDYTTTWDDVDDFTPPPAEEVSPTFWQSLMNAIKWWEG